MKTPRHPTDRRIARPNTLPCTGVRLKPARTRATAATAPTITAKLFVSTVISPITMRSTPSAAARLDGASSGIQTRAADTSNSSGVKILRGSRFLPVVTTCAASDWAPCRAA